jgi:hypothetical protein
MRRPQYKKPPGTAELPSQKSSRASILENELAAALAPLGHTPRGKNALELIRPRPAQRTQCEHAVERAIQHIEADKALEKFSTPTLSADLKKRCRSVAKKLRAVEVSNLVSGSFREQARRERETLEILANRLRARPGGHRKKAAKQVAVHVAHRLLTNFGSHPPKHTRGGAWEELAAILYGERDADLFDYLTAHRDHPPWLADVFSAFD